ncbi:MAG: hypothetical protein IJO79_05980, partial [Firmicutes bacterium]|nr:hypothetical protein [Bacillota bacterium]
MLKGWACTQQVIYTNRDIMMKRDALHKRFLIRTPFLPSITLLSGFTWKPVLLFLSLLCEGAEGLQKESCPRTGKLYIKGRLKKHGKLCSLGMP